MPQTPNLAQEIVSKLRQEASEDDRLVAEYQLPGREASFAPWPDWVPSQVREAYALRGVAQPWTHQAEAADLAFRGRATVVATGTGSGKSLAAWLPILSQVTAFSQTASTHISQLHKRPTALYLSPTKALAADQLAALLAVVQAPSEPLPIQVGVCDGDTGRDAKQWARAHADIVVTNPDYVHHVLLAGHQYWTRLLRSLRYVIVDEAHSYRGVVGAHMSLVVRRLLRLAKHYGADPTVIALSATVAQPQAMLARFLGIPEGEVSAVTADASPAGEKFLVLWQPKLIDFGPDSGLGEGARANVDLGLTDEVGADADFGLTDDDGQGDDLGLTDELGLTDDPADKTGAGGMEFQRRSLNLEAANVSALALSLGAKTLTFMRSRVGAERVAKLTRRLLEVDFPQVAGAFAAYRGGFLPEERRELERRIRTGELAGLASTNALELGVDISGLDVTVTAGWPGTRASFWQQVGRSGRAGQGGVSIFVSSENPLDNYLLHHPDSIFSEVEVTAFNTANPFVLGPHLCAAAAELPLQESDFELFGLDDDLILRQLAEQGLLTLRPRGWFWNATLELRPHDLADLRGMGQNVQVVDSESGTVIGSVDEPSAHRLVHPGAIYTHQGKTYEVLRLEPNLALVRSFNRALTTRPTVQTSVEIVNPLVSWVCEDELLEWHWGETKVISKVTDYDILRTPKLQFVSNRKLDLPPRVLETTSAWFTLSPRVAEQLEISPADLPGALHAAEHAMIGILPLLATCDRSDLGGLSTVEHPQTRLSTVFVHDAVAGGAGFSESGFQQAKTWIEKTLNTVEQCPCEAGCPACVQSPKCGNNNDPLHKAGAVKILRFVLNRTTALLRELS